MKFSFIEQIQFSGLLESNVFALPISQQDKYFKKFLIENYQLLQILYIYKFPDAGNIEVPVLFPNKTNQLLKKYNKDTIRILDMIYSVLIVRKSIITLKVLSKDLIDCLRDNNITQDALVSMFFDDYAILPQEIKKEFKPFSSKTFRLSNLN